MARSKFDISNSAIRIFLQDVGKFYDEARGFFDPFGPKVSQKDELLDFFKHECCFCSAEINRKSLSHNHLISMNKKSLGLHAWGNVVPSLNLHLGSISFMIKYFACTTAHNEHSFQ